MARLTRPARSSTASTDRSTGSSASGAAVANGANASSPIIATVTGVLQWLHGYIVEILMHDTAMMLMGLGACCKFIELVVLRTDYSVVRFLFSILGGILIAAGSGLVTWSTIQAIREHWAAAAAEKAVALSKKAR